MNEFDPSQPCQPFRADRSPGRGRSGNLLLFVQQGDRRFVVKSHDRPGNAPDTSIRRLQWEVDAVRAFAAIGVQVLRPVWGPADTLELQVEGQPLTLRHVLVFPFHDGRTLQEAIRQTPDPVPLVREAARRILERHRRARSVCEIHSDGAPHNIFEDWTWFDLDELPSTRDLRTAKAGEVWRFLTGVIDVTPLGQARTRVTAFCDVYDDRDVLRLARELRRKTCPLLRMLLQPYQFCRLAFGKSSSLGRLRTGRELSRYLAETNRQTPRPQR